MNPIPDPILKPNIELNIGPDSEPCIEPNTEPKIECNIGSKKEFYQKNLDLDIFDQTFFGTNVFEQKEQQQKQQPQPQF